MLRTTFLFLVLASSCFAGELSPADFQLCGDEGHAKRIASIQRRRRLLEAQVAILSAAPKPKPSPKPQPVSPRVEQWRRLPAAPFRTIPHYSYAAPDCRGGT